jgi:hypothetical protein
MVWRSVIIEPEVDVAVRGFGVRHGIGSAAVFRLFLDSGIAQAMRGARLPAIKEKEVQALRTLYINIAVDDELCRQSYDRRISKRELTTRLARLGMVAVLSLTDVATLAGQSK